MVLFCAALRGPSSYCHPHAHCLPSALKTLLASSSFAPVKSANASQIKAAASLDLHPPHRGHVPPAQFVHRH
ncbi:hypothetical protein B0H10DRAFT_1977164, partial [Mycena sp. CBHHK59/15]